MRCNRKNNHNTSNLRAWVLRFNSILIFYLLFGAQGVSGLFNAENQIKKSVLPSQKRAFFSVANFFSYVPAFLAFNLGSGNTFGAPEGIGSPNAVGEKTSFGKNLESLQEINLSGECACFEKVGFFGENSSPYTDLSRENNIPDEDLSDEEETSSEKNNSPEEKESADEIDSPEKTDSNKQPGKSGNNDITASAVFYKLIQYSSLKSIFLPSSSSLPKRKAIPLFILYHSWKSFLR
jgi:hypothetical protein